MAKEEINTIYDGESTVKIGGLYFMELFGLLGFGVTSYDGIKRAECDAYSINKYNPEESDYYVVKYMGNGIFVEMLTGTKILSSYTSVEMEDRGSDMINKSCELSFDDYKKENPKRNGIMDYVQKLSSVKKLAEEIPLFLDVDNALCIFSEELKKEYLKKTDAERIKKLKKSIEDAESSKKEAIKIIDSYLAKESVLTREMIEQAYFENQVYDFSRKLNIENK